MLTFYFDNILHQVYEAVSPNHKILQNNYLDPTMPKTLDNRIFSLQEIFSNRQLLYTHCILIQGEYTSQENLQTLISIAFSKILSYRSRTYIIRQSFNHFNFIIFGVQNNQYSLMNSVHLLSKVLSVCKLIALEIKCRP